MNQKEAARMSSLERSNEQLREQVRDMLAGASTSIVYVEDLAHPERELSLPDTARIVFRSDVGNRDRDVTVRWAGDRVVLSVRGARLYVEPMSSNSIAILATEH